MARQACVVSEARAKFRYEVFRRFSSGLVLVQGEQRRGADFFRGEEGEIAEARSMRCGKGRTVCGAFFLVFFGVFGYRAGNGIELGVIS